jgi:magnesium-transporting ATPase (P-type)
LQLLWINLITDEMPAVALGTDPIDDALMQRPPRPPHLRLLAWTASGASSVTPYSSPWGRSPRWQSHA